MDQTNPTAVSATLECLDGILLSLVFDGEEVARTWGVQSVEAALDRLRDEAVRSGQSVTLTCLGDALPETVQPRPVDGRLLVTPGGTWMPAPPAPASQPAQPGAAPATLTHHLAHGVPEESGDLFDIDNTEFAASPETDYTALAGEADGEVVPTGPGAEQAVDPFEVAAPASTVPQPLDLDGLFSRDPEPTKVRPPASESTAPPVVAPERMSRGELDEWVAQELLNPEKASSGSGTIRTRTGTGGPSEKQRVLGVAALCALLLIGVLGVGGLLLTGGGGGNGGGGSKEPEVTGPFDIKPAVMTASPGKPDAIPGYKQVWDLNVGGQSVAVTRYAVVSAKDRELAITNPANGAPITTVKAYGQVKALLSGKVVGADGALTKVLAWQYEDTLNVQALEGAPLPKSVQVNLPKGATVSARLDGILITDPSASGKVGILVSRPGKKGQFGVDVRWLDAPSSSTTNSGAEQANNGSTREVAASNQRRWAYAATPAGDVWWLNADGTASFPGTEATVLTVGQPKEGTSFAGWLGEGFGPTPDPSRQVTADVLVGVWRDPVDGTLILATYLAKDAAAEDEVEPVAAVAIQSGVADDGTTGTTSSHIGIGTWLIDAATGQIAASGTRNGMRVAGVYGAVAEIADSDGDLRFVTQPMLADAAKQAQALAEQQGDKSTRPSPSQSEVGPTSTPDATGVVYQAAATDGPSSETSPSASAKNDDGLVDLPVPLLPFDILGATADGTLIVSSGNRVLALRPTGSGS